MAQGLFTATPITTLGVAPTLSTPSVSGDAFANNEKEFIFATNGSASDRVITIAAQKKCDFGDAHDIVVTVPTSASRLIGPFPTRWYSNGSDKVVMTYNSVTDLTIGIFQLT